MYSIVYQKDALMDLREIAAYIAFKLENPIAASKLTDEIEKGISRLKSFPYCNPVYCSMIKPEYEFRKLVIKKYLVFYTVDEEKKLVIIRRIILGSRRIEKMI